MHTFFVYLGIGIGVLNLLLRARWQLGLHYPSSFVFAHKVVRRPRSFSSPLQREAFARVGSILSNPMTDDILFRFRAQHLLSGAEGRLPLRVWQEALDLYHREGIMEFRYVLAFSTGLEDAREERPTWDAWGQRFPKVHRWGYESFGEFPPLKEEEMLGLIGTPFPKCSFSSLRSGEKMEFATLTEKHFLKVYYRPLEYVANPD